MAFHLITDEQMGILLHDQVLDKLQQEIVTSILTKNVLTLPKEHKAAVGTAYYGALAGSGPWEIVNGTGTVISLLITSINDGGSIPSEKSKIETAHTEWVDAMIKYSVKEDDSQKFRAAAICERILGNIGKLAYKYGTIPSGGFRLPVPVTTGGGTT
jgi:hypothetical protein